MMGQHCEDVLEGLACQECGMFMEDFMNSGKQFDAPGYPRTCASCEPPRKANGKPLAAMAPVPRTPAQQEARRAKNKGKRMRNKANRAARALAAP